MANERKIHGAVSIGNRTYVAGQEQELAAAMKKANVTADQVLAVDPKVLSGAWGQSASAAGSGDEGGEDKLPTLEQLPAALQKLTSVDEVIAMAEHDDRKGAVELYEARIAELEAGQ